MPERWLIAIVVAMIMLFSASLYPLLGQEHRHPPQDAGIHHKFYSTWMMPSNRAVSCCHDEDCFPAQAKYDGENWYARKDDSEEWIKVPRERIEKDRDSPDGRSHLCGRTYGFSNGEFTVFCFINGIQG